MIWFPVGAGIGKICDDATMYSFSSFFFCIYFFWWLRYTVFRHYASLHWLAILHTYLRSTKYQLYFKCYSRPCSSMPLSHVRLSTSDCVIRRTYIKSVFYKCQTVKTPMQFGKSIDICIAE